jgi:hypothetical protein
MEYTRFGLTGMEVCLNFFWNVDLNGMIHGYATEEGCRTKRKTRNLEYAVDVRLTGFTAKA